MSMIEELKSFDCFTNSEKAVIDVIFRDPDALPTLTAQQLAKEAYTSASTVVRLGQKLGCKSYNEFRTKLVAEMQRRSNGNAHVDANTPFGKEDTLEDVLKQITNLQLNGINDTFAQLDMKCFEHAVAMLSNADCIDIYGRGMNIHLAYDFAFKLVRIGRKVQISIDYEQQIINAVTRYKNHCAILISYTGETSQAIEYARALKDSGVPFIAITCVGENTVASLADERLTISSQERFYFKMGSVSSAVSIISILNYLYAGIFSQDYEKSYRKRHEMIEVLQKYQYVSNSTLFKSESNKEASLLEKQGSNGDE